MEDTEIVELYWARDERAIEESERKYGALCRSVALRVLESVEDSEECVSDTWLRSWNVIPPRRPTLLGAFLARITRNLALDRWRASRAEKRGGGETALALEELEDCVSGESLEGELERQALLRALNAFLRSLPKGDRRLFLRRYWSVETLESLARAEGQSVTAVHRRLRRLRERLAEHLRKEGIEP